MLMFSIGQWRQIVLLIRWDEEMESRMKQRHSFTNSQREDIGSNERQRNDLEKNWLRGVKNRVTDDTKEE